MVKKSFLDILEYPLAMWLVFLIASLIVGFTSFANLSIQVMLGTTALFLAILFGAWVGRRSAKAFDNVIVGALSALMLSVVVGFVMILFTFILVNYSSAFATQISAFGSASSVALSAGITIWIEVIMIAMVSAAAAAEFSSRK